MKTMRVYLPVDVVVGFIRGDRTVSRELQFMQAQADYPREGRFVKAGMKTDEEARDTFYFEFEVDE